MPVVMVYTVMGEMCRRQCVSNQCNRSEIYREWKEKEKEREKGGDVK